MKNKLNMKSKLNGTIVLLLIVNANCFAQNAFYKVNGGKIIDEKNYTEYKENLVKKGKIEEFNLKTISKNDSIINYVKLGNLITTPDGYDPWGETKNFIGTKFQIEKFINNNSQNFKNDYLEGKPTYINFWFTRCPPCIEELPTLKKLKEKYENKVNFISVTFDNQDAIDVFLKKYEFNFKHITNSKKQIEELNISAYPTSLILDKNGIVKIVTGEITEYDLKDVETILNILL
jgi:thiol-disulfide isomerase/thioredoxin